MSLLERIGFAMGRDMRHQGTRRVATMTRAVCSACVLLALGLAALPARAEHVLQATLSLSSTSARDDLLIPLAFTGPKLDLGARYGFNSGAHRIEADLSAGIGVMWNRFDQQAEQLSHGLSFGYLHALGEDPSERLWLGGILRWHDELSYLESWDDAHGYWLSTLTLGPLLRHELQMLSWLALESRGELALFGLMARPPEGFRRNKQDDLTLVGYHLDRIADGTQLVGPWDVQVVRLEAIARVRGSDEPAGSGFGVGLHAGFSHTADPQPYALLVAGLVITYGGEL